MRTKSSFLRVYENLSLCANNFAHSPDEEAYMDAYKTTNNLFLAAMYRGAKTYTNARKCFCYAINIIYGL